jgi:hypothetical protein
MLIISFSFFSFDFEDVVTFAKDGVFVDGFEGGELFPVVGLDIAVDVVEVR